MKRSAPLNPLLEGRLQNLSRAIGRVQSDVDDFSNKFGSRLLQKLESAPIAMALPPTGTGAHRDPQKPGHDLHSLGSDHLVRLPSFLGLERRFARADVMARKRNGL